MLNFIGAKNSQVTPMIVRLNTLQFVKIGQMSVFLKSSATVSLISRSSKTIGNGEL